MIRKKTKKSIFTLLAIFAALAVTAQTDLNFNRYTLLSGTNLQAGAVYRFASVKPDVDAIVTIEKITSSASLDTLDFTPLGYTAILQPQLSVVPHSWGYVVFNVQFVLAGSQAPIAQSSIPAKGNNYKTGFRNDVKIEVINSSVTSFKVRMYMSNHYDFTLNRKAELYIEKYEYENPRLSEATNSTCYLSEAKGN